MVGGADREGEGKEAASKDEGVKGRCLRGGFAGLTTTVRR